MVLLDWVGLAVILLSMVLGLVRGLVYEVLMLAGWVIAFLVAQWLAEDVGRWLPFGDPQAGWRYAAGFVLVFVAVAFGAGLVASLLRKLVVATGLRPVDRSLGAVFGMARAAVALLAIAVVVHLTALNDGALWRESHGALWLDEALRGMKPALPEKLASFLP